MKLRPHNAFHLPAAQGLAFRQTVAILFSIVIENDCLHDLSHHERHQLLRGLPELPVDEAGGEAAHECELFCLPWTDLEDTRLQGRKGLLHQLLRRHQSDAAALGNVCRQVGLHRGRHEFDDLHAGFLQLKSQRLGVGVNRRFRGAVDWRRRQRHEREGRGCVDHGALICPENVDERRSHANYAAYVDIHLGH